MTPIDDHPDKDEVSNWIDIDDLLSEEIPDSYVEITGTEAEFNELAKSEEKLAEILREGQQEIVEDYFIKKKIRRMIAE